MTKFTVFTVLMLACLGHAAWAQQVPPHKVNATITIPSALTPLQAILANQTASDELRAALTRDLFRILQLNEETLSVVYLTHSTLGGGRGGSRTSLLSNISVAAQTMDRARIITARLIALPNVANNLSDTVAVLQQVSPAISAMVVGGVIITSSEPSVSTQDDNSVRASISNGGCRADPLLLLPILVFALICAQW
jgi:hypothetical protein